jgi:hypothetical protein
MIKFTGVVLSVLVSFCTVANGDTITLRNVGRDIEVKVIGVTGEYVDAAILKNSIKSLNMQVSNTGNYTDLISLNVANAAIECKVKEVSENAIRVLIPTSAISSLQMSFQTDDKQIKTLPPVGVDNRPKITDVIVKKEQMEDQRLEAKIKDDTGDKVAVEDIRTSPAEKTGAGKDYRLKTKKKKKEKFTEESDLSKPEAEVTSLGMDEAVGDEKSLEDVGKASGLTQEQVVEPKDDKDENEEKEEEKVIQEEVKKEKPVKQNPNLGNVEGKILHSGSPLPDCQVKLQMLEKSGLLAKGYRPIDGAVEIETVTDKDGVYHFENVSPGLYKLYWKPPSETSWVRRFKMEPDVIVEPGKNTNPKNIETLKRTLN